MTRVSFLPLVARSPHVRKTLVPGTLSEVSQVSAITELPITLSDKVEKTNVSPIKVDLKKVKRADQTTTETKFSNYRLRKTRGGERPFQTSNSLRHRPELPLTQQHFPSKDISLQ